MGRKYTNRKDEEVQVSDEHLDTAIKLKIEIQKSSPSRKCNWRLHKKCMEKEGFLDSDTNESYRCLIKDEQKKRNQLPEAPKYADMVADGKLESIKELVGEIGYEKRENQLVLRELNKVKREVIDESLVAEQIGKAFDGYDWSKLKFTYENKLVNKKNESVSNSKMVVALSDLHIGALVDLDINKFNYEIAVERMAKYLNKVVSEARKEKVSEIYVMNLGDVVEHSNMRYGQARDVEFVYSDQIVIASDIIIKFLVGLEDNGFKVKYAGIAGNHDRVDGDKNKSLSGDHAVKSINRSIQSFITNAKRKNIEFVQAKDYKHSFEINGKNFLALHGDLDSKGDANILSKHSEMDGIHYDYILMGHYHTREVRELGNDKFLLMSGSLKGADEYSDRIRKLSAPSQSFYVINEDGELDIKFVSFKGV